MGRYRADRLSSALFRRGASRVVLCGPVDVSSFLGQKVDYRFLAADADDEAMLALWAEAGVDVVVPSLYPLEQEQALTALAVACRRSDGRRWACVHSPQFAKAVSDKVVFHRLALKEGWPVPDGVICDEPAELAGAVALLGLPVLVKTGRSMPWEGRHYLADSAALAGLPQMDFPIVVQRACQGGEYGIELLTDRDGRTARWPVAHLGPLDARCMPGWRTRVMPTPLPGPVGRQLEAVIDDIADTLSPYGPWQCDLAVEDGQLHILEINGRFGGMAHLSRSVTNIDPYDALAATALGVQAPQPLRAGRAAAEIPLALAGALPPLPDGMRCEPELPTPTEPCLLTHFHRTLVTAGDPTTLHSWIAALPADALADLDAAENYNNGHAHR
jgi:hypothetical protein